MRLPLRAAVGILLATLLQGCGVYLHDARLVPPAKTAEESLTGANITAPFDAQLNSLKAFAAEEDLTVATFRAAYRNDQLAQLIAGHLANPSLADIVNARMQILAPTIANQPAALRELVQAERDRRALTEEKAMTARMIVRERAGYVAALTVAASKGTITADEAKARETKSGCADVRQAVSEAQVDAPLSSGDPLSQTYGQLAKQCWIDETSTRDIAKIDTLFQGAGGLIAEIANAVAEAEKADAPDLSASAQTLASEIKEAEDAAKKVEKESLVSLRDDIKAVLDAAGQAARVAGWDKVDETIAKLLRAEVCTADKDSVEAETYTKADCDNLDPASTAGKVAASWAFAEAVSQLLQSQDPKLRTVQWLLAAKAIVAAEKADAKLQLDEARAVIAAERARLVAHLRELGSLGFAQQALAGQSAPGCQATSDSCAFGAYVLSWDEGRIPGEVLVYRPIQLAREFAVRRAKVAVGRQYALALTGAGTLKAGAEGGLKPELIAQLLFDLTLIGVTAGN